MPKAKPKPPTKGAKKRPPRRHRGANASTLSNPQPWFVNWATGGEAAPGPVVNEHTSLKYITVFSCVSLLAGVEASLPLITYRRGKSGRGKDRAFDLNVYGVLHDEFNPRTSSPVARETMMGHLLTWGNCYAQIVRNKSGSEVLQLSQLGPDVVTPRLTEGRKPELVYDVYQRETRELIATLPATDMIHVPGLGFDGFVGYSPIRVAKSAIRAGMAQDQQAERFVTRGIRPPGAVKFDKGKKFANEQQAIEWRKRFNLIHSHEEADLNIVVLEDGADWVSLGIDPVDAQLLESREFSALQVCGLYRVPPHMVGLVSKSTSWGTGIGEQVDGFIKFTLLPWLTKKEKEFNRKLFGAGGDVFCEYLLEGLERADIQKRTEAMLKQLQSGVRSPNEWREMENLNPHPGGDVYFFPLNLGRVDSEGNDLPPPEQAATQPKPPPASNPDALAATIRRNLAASLARCLRKEAERAKGWAKRPDQFIRSAEEFYADHRAMVEEHVRPPLETWQAAFPAVSGGAVDWPSYLADLHCNRSVADLVAAAECQPTELLAAVERLTQRWLTERPAEVAANLQLPEVSRAV